MGARGASPRRSSWRWIAAVVVVGLAIAGCGGDDDDEPAGTGQDTETSSSEPKTGGTLRYAISQDISTWMPTLMEVGDLGVLVFDTLLAIDEEGQWAPHMADMETEDGKTWTMTLQEGIQFSDGTPLDAEAVKFNVGLFLDPEQGSDFRTLVLDVTEMNVIDDLTLEFVLSQPNGPFPFAFAHLPGMMISPTAYQADPAGFAENPVGAGPFMLESWTRDARSVLVRNPNYWGTRPYLDRIETVIIPDENSRGQALATGEIDAARQVGYQVEEAVAGRDEFHRANAGGNGAEAMAPNQDRPPFDDVRIREALALAIDTSIVNQTLMFGTWDEERFTCPPFSPNQPECLPDLWPEPDPARAKELVAEYEAEKGPLTGGYEMLVVSARQAEGELLQQMWSAVGIDFTINSVTGAEYAQRLANQSYHVGNNIMISFTGPARSLYRNMFSHERAGRHVQGGPVDPELEEVMNTALTAVDDEERIEAAHEFQRMNAEQFLNVWYLPSGLGVITHEDVKVPDSWGGAFFTRPAEIWLDR
jgi:peptide/nickel transport system substrate-binding protein